MPASLKVKAGETAGSLGAGGHTAQRIPHPLGFSSRHARPGIFTPLTPQGSFPGTQTHFLQRGCSSSYSEIIIKEEITILAVLFSLLILKLSFL